ncbi:predicted protein [Histoplasma capsulatum G186AR]|uniref:Uncharacterized protein n=1 Tax=Ajellomyces capsulatus (strain G186AR / H82 / ATCC MYA-2454 / RMSCC 2432) TaxID=447093 RepID=C0NWM2_AJECG|nr:uncharacterized protein HCBG_07552 [Histoplasma capsulatum G186AR]EEH04327.1 predicted protein [Histoplasma capsulatum G186AR]
MSVLFTGVLPPVYRRLNVFFLPGRLDISIMQEKSDPQRMSRVLLTFDRLNCLMMFLFHVGPFPCYRITQDRWDPGIEKQFQPEHLLWSGVSTANAPLIKVCAEDGLRGMSQTAETTVYAAQYTVSLKAENGAFTANLGLATSAQPTFDLVTVEDGSPIELGEGSKNEQVMLANHGEDTRAYAANKYLQVGEKDLSLLKKQ